MLALRGAALKEIDRTDPFRGTVQRWTVDSGALSGSTCDHAFNEDWSLSWRFVAGPGQGQVGRARQFMLQAVRAQLYLVTFSTTPGVVISATVDFASRRLAGFQYEAEHCRPFSGSIRVL